MYINKANKSSTARQLIRGLTGTSVSQLVLGDFDREGGGGEEGAVCRGGEEEGVCVWERGRGKGREVKCVGGEEDGCCVGVK